MVGVGRAVATGVAVAAGLVQAINMSVKVAKRSKGMLVLIRPFQRIKYAVGAACRRPFAASQTRGGRAAAPTHDFVGQALDTYFFESALGLPWLFLRNQRNKIDFMPI